MKHGPTAVLTLSGYNPPVVEIIQPNGFVSKRMVADDDAALGAAITIIGMGLKSGTLVDFKCNFDIPKWRPWYVLLWHDITGLGRKLRKLAAKLFDPAPPSGPEF